MVVDGTYIQIVFPAKMISTYKKTIYTMLYTAFDNYKSTFS